MLQSLWRSDATYVNFRNGNEIMLFVLYFISVWLKCSIITSEYVVFYCKSQSIEFISYFIYLGNCKSNSDDEIKRSEDDRKKETKSIKWK
jgi:hypothetical protein